MKFLSKFFRTTKKQQSSTGQWKLRLEKGLRLWAVWMQKQTEKLSGRCKWLAFSCFVISAGILCSYVAIQAFNTDPPIVRPPVIHINPLRLKDGTEKLSTSIVSPSQYHRILQFRDYADNAGIMDSLQEHRPGLLDSMAIIEQLYLTQQQQNNDTTK